MKKRIVIAHAGKGFNEIQAIKKLAIEKFPDANLCDVNYCDLSLQQLKDVVKQVDAIIISGFGRIVEKGGADMIYAARDNKIPVYFIIKFDNDSLDDYEAKKWVNKRISSRTLKKFVITLLNVDDEIRTKYCGNEVIVLPTYAM